MSTAPQTGTVEPFRFEDGALLILDQRALPAEERWIRCETVEQVAECIRTLAVRGAPAIGIAAAYALVLNAHLQRETAPLFLVANGVAIQATFEPRTLSRARQVELVDAGLDRLRA